MIERVTRGEVPRKHHLALRDAGGHLLYEEAFTRQGFGAGNFRALFESIEREQQREGRS